MVALSIIIPAYNEEKRIERTLVEYCEFFKQKTAFDIHVIINGCVDDTIGVVKKISKKYKQINYVDIGNVGSKGAAVNYGFKIAEGGLIGFVDADLATKPDAFYDMVKAIDEDENVDGVIASRWIKGARYDKNKIGFFHIFAGRSFNLIANSFFNLRIRNAGLNSLEKTPLKLSAKSWG